MSQKEISNREMSVAAAWPIWVKARLRDARTRHVLIRDEDGRYAPNPAKPPRAMHVDGTLYAYTREAWLETTRVERTTGEIHTMTMEVERFLGGRSQDELLLVLDELASAVSFAAAHYAAKQSSNPTTNFGVGIDQDEVGVVAYVGWHQGD